MERVRYAEGPAFGLTAVAVERRERLPQRIRCALMELRGDRLQQADIGQAAERFLRPAPRQNLVVLLEQPRERALCNLVPVRADRVEQGRLDREVEARRERNRAQHANGV